MLQIDGAQQLGSGTLVRFAVVLSGLTGRPVEIVNARAGRPKPGLRPQHVAAVRACAALCEARVEGVAVGSSALRFHPSGRIHGGSRAFAVGTAGSASMLALTLLPLAAFADRVLEARIEGGVFQDFAPSPLHMRFVLLPILERMGLRASLEVARPGYVPTGGGQLLLRVAPARPALAPLALLEPGRVEEVAGVALSSHLTGRRVSERMAQTCEAVLVGAGLRCAIERVDDDRAPQPGASLCVWAESSTGCRFGADRAGARRRSSEAIGRVVAKRFLADVASGGTTDRHLADQLVLFAALARGTSRWTPPRWTPHLASNLWLAELFGAAVRRVGRSVEVRGIERVQGEGGGATSPG
jgi:RNA 3'-terminal phosphate cyclase (ATP)